MSDYSNFISKKIIFAATVHGSKPLLKQAPVTSYINITDKVDSDCCKNKKVSLSLAATTRKKTSAF